jgi:hypothetical protein
MGFEEINLVIGPENAFGFRHGTLEKLKSES